jgi:hypothetical protein
MNILSIVSQNLDNFYQIQTKCYRNSNTVFFSLIDRTKGGLATRRPARYGRAHARTDVLSLYVYQYRYQHKYSPVRWNRKPAEILFQLIF